MFKYESYTEQCDVFGVDDDRKSFSSSTLTKIAIELNSRGVKTAKDAQWHGTSVLRCIQFYTNKPYVIASVWYVGILPIYCDEGGICLTQTQTTTNVNNMLTIVLLCVCCVYGN